MTFRLSTGARNGLVGSMGLLGMFNRGIIKVFTGAQPSSADAAETGTLLGTVSTSGSAVTRETRATGSITLTGGSSGSINTVTVGGKNIIPDGAVAYNTSLNQTASDLCDAINRNGVMEARVSGAVVTLRGRPGTGVTTEAVTATLTTITATYVNMGSGVAGVAPVAGLLLGPAGYLLGVETAGVLAKPSSQTWSVTPVADGTAGWWRFYASDTADSGGLLTAAPWYPRMDGACGVGSGELQLSTLSLTTGVPVTVDSWKITMPAA